MNRKLWGNFGIREEWIMPGALLIMLILVSLVAAVLVLRHRAERMPVPTAAPGPPTRKLMESTLAGRWYEADKTKLAAEIDGYLANVSEEPLSDVMALVMPHAGYRYSGQTAAHSAKEVAGRTFSRVIIMGPSHSVPMENMAAVPDATHYATPLGEIPLDWEFIATLTEYPEFRTFPEAHEGEHSVQIEVPLLQEVLGAFRFVPIVVGDADEETTERMAHILCGLIDEQTLVVASSDFTHYGPNYRYVPFEDNVAANLEQLDMGAFEEIKKKDAAGFRAYCEETEATICGRCPIGILLAMLPETAEAHLLKYDTSGRMTNDYRNSVSYVSVAFTGKWEKGERAAMEPAQNPLTEDDKRALLKLARGTLEYALENRRMPTPEDLGIAVTPGMKNVMGAFVTLKEEGQLRGCIGEIFPQRPLYRAVMEQAVNAGLRDHRFPQVQPSELQALHFEISALTPPHPIASYRDIVLGRDGVVIDKDGYRAVFLPQVAPEQGWDVNEMLTHLSQKAGLPSDAWKEGASFTVFEAVVFSEESA